MNEYRIDASDNVRDIVPHDEKITSITSVPGAVVVETEPWQQTDEEGDGYEDMSRSELYSEAQDKGLDVQWQGDESDSADDMRAKLRAHEEDN